MNIPEDRVLVSIDYTARRLSLTVGIGAPVYLDAEQALSIADTLIKSTNEITDQLLRNLTFEQRQIAILKAANE